MSDKKKTALTVRIDEDLSQAFKKACDDKDYSQSLVIRELIKNGLWIKTGRFFSIYNKLVTGQH